MELAFVAARGQNWFWRDLIDTLRFELDELGVATGLTDAGFPDPRPDLVYVIAPPHEYVALEGPDALGDDPLLLGRTIFICGEQPESGHFDSNVELSESAGAVFDINSQSVRRMRARGIAAEYLPLGHTARWDHFDPSTERDIDVLFYGCRSPRRTRTLARAARLLSRRHCYLHLSDNSVPNIGPAASFMTDAKWPLLQRSKVVINIHQSDEPYFEWLRALDAFHSGAVFISEHSTGFEPLTPGRDFFSCSPDALPHVVDRVLSDDALRTEVAASAYELIREHRRMSAAASRLAAVAEQLTRRPISERPPPRGGRRRILALPDKPRHVTGDPDASMIRRGLKDARLDAIDLRRALSRVQVALATAGEPIPRVRQIHTTSAWPTRENPRVSVLTALYNHSAEVTEALDSVARSRFRSFELIVVNDGSSDDSADAVRRWMDAHDDLPGTLIEHPVNRGLGHARNTALEFARGEFCLVLDADNEIYPRCLEALVGHLDLAPQIAFAYPILEVFGHADGFVAADGDYLASQFAWEPRWLRRTNFIDALAIIRTRVLRELGGYATDRRLYGLEDYDLWCRIADRGMDGKLVPEILARYRSSPSSMLSLTGLSMTSAYAALIERSPRLFEGVVAPD